jgi:hypothetical protein
MFVDFEANGILSAPATPFNEEQVDMALAVLDRKLGCDLGSSSFLFEGSIASYWERLNADSTRFRLVELVCSDGKKIGVSRRLLEERYV